MKSGLYWEYICPKCVWLPSEYIGLNSTPEQEKMAKQRLEQRVAEHNKKYHK